MSLEQGPVFSAQVAPGNVEFKEENLKLTEQGERKSFSLTRISTATWANYFCSNGLKVLHVCFHAEMAEQEIANESSENDRNENIAVVHHYSQHQPILQQIVKDKDRKFFGAFEKLFEEGLSEYRIALSARQKRSIFTRRAW